jgi:hypothetical protein
VSQPQTKRLNALWEPSYMPSFDKQNERVKRLLAHIEETRRDYERETKSRRRLLSGLEPQAPQDPLDAEIEASWQRLYRDYQEYRRQRGYPQPSKKNDGSGQ